MAPYPGHNFKWPDDTCPHFALEILSFVPSKWDVWSIFAMASRRITADSAIDLIFALTTPMAIP